MDIKLILASKVKYFRLLNKLSQESLAEKAGLDRTYVQSIEKGKRNISITVVQKLAIALDVKISLLLEE